MERQGWLVGNTWGIRHPERFSRGKWCRAACYKTRPVFCPYGPARKQLFNFAPGKISLVTFLLLQTKFIWNKFEPALLDPKGE